MFYSINMSMRNVRPRFERGTYTESNSSTDTLTGSSITPPFSPGPTCALLISGSSDTTVDTGEFDTSTFAGNDATDEVNAEGNDMACVHMMPHTVATGDAVWGHSGTNWSSGGFWVATVEGLQDTRKFYGSDINFVASGTTIDYDTFFDRNGETFDANVMIHCCSGAGANVGFDATDSGFGGTGHGSHDKAWDSNVSELTDGGDHTLFSTFTQIDDLDTETNLIATTGILTSNFRYRGAFAVMI